MEIISFKEANTIYAEDQSKYKSLPCFRYNVEEGRLACCWKLTFFERLQVLFTGKIWHNILTFYQPLQPQLLQVNKPKDMNWENDINTKLI